ncbi:MAG TPA: hypothetical protein VLC06_16450 [Polyangia bacterium]|nr:hypothetical protein [Polyangia bacterium]
MARSLSPAPLLSLARVAAVVMAVASAIGCAQDPSASGPAVKFDPCTPVTLIPDATATAAQLAGVTAGAALWNASASSDLLSASSAGGSAGPALPIHFQVAAAPFNGLYDAPSGQIYINDDLTGDELEITIAHEIGHSFGLVHIPTSVRPSLMNPANLTVLPTAADVATLAGLWGRCGSLDAAGTE